jgi:hypothetical protein
MQGTIDNLNHNTLIRIVERVISLKRTGRLKLFAKPNGQEAVLDIGGDEVSAIAYNGLSGNAALEAIKQVQHWDFQFIDPAEAPLGTKRPKLKTGPVTLEAVPAAEAREKREVGFVKFEYDGVSFQPKPVPTPLLVHDFVQDDCYYLRHQAKLIGQTLGLMTPKSITIREMPMDRTVAYRGFRGSAYRGILATETNNVINLNRRLENARRI